jgi:hypothetical protein
VSLADTVIRLASGTYTAARQTGGMYANGIWVPLSFSTFEIVASIQPASGEDLVRVPEGVRTRELVTVFTPTELQVKNAPAGTEADRVAYKGATYEVQTVEKWDESGSYYRAVAAKIEQ